MDQFLSLTPLQFQKASEKMHIRRHNARAFTLSMHGAKIEGTEADFIDTEENKVNDMIDEQIEAERQVQLSLQKNKELKK